jgi:hypothetical protein
MMEKIIEPVKRENLIAELKFCKLIKQTVRGGNEIYSFTNTDAPQLMVEVGRLREEAFRSVGCGTGNSIDLDDYDFISGAYRQLIVWNPREQKIVSGYRYAVGSKYSSQIEHLSMSQYFRYSRKFKTDYLPNAIELGRAWVNPAYRLPESSRNSIFALDNIWEGIGALIAENSNVKYLFGKVTIPNCYNQTARFLLLWFLENYFKDKNNLAAPLSRIIPPKVQGVGGLQVSGIDKEYDFKIIANYIRSQNITVPPMLNVYLRLTRDMISFGTTINSELGNSYETGILIAIKDIHPEKQERYIGTFKKKRLEYA